MTYHIFIDGAARVTHKNKVGEASAAAVFYSGKKRRLVGCRGLGKRTSLEAEYEALIMALIMSISQDIESPIIYSDSITVCDQVNGIKPCTTDEVRSLLYTVETIKKDYSFTLTHVDRKKVWEADMFCNTYLDNYKASI